MTQSKERSNEFPPIDRTFEFDQSPEFACGVIRRALRHMTLEQIAAHAGISKRNLYYFQNHGFTKFPQQITLQILAGDIQIER